MDDTDVSNRYNTYDYVVMALLAAVSAVAYVLLAQIWTALTAALGPLGGALLGLFQFGHLLAFAVLRKPGVTFFTSVLTTVGQLLLGDPSGAYVLGWGIIHGAAAEGVFFASRYRKCSFGLLALAAGLAAVLGQLYSYYVFGWDSAQYLFFISLPLVFLSSALESGAIAYFAAQPLKKLAR
jgi:ABC-type thiamin/hydroxymethylpyrimidine transport system permease subunit